MARIAKPKTVKELEALKQPGFYPVGGVSGLYLTIKQNSKTYVFRYTAPGTQLRTMIGLGPFKGQSLTDVRRQAFEYRDMVRRGINPKYERDRRKQAEILENQRIEEGMAAREHTVEYCITAYLDELAKANYWEHNIRGEPVARSYVRRNVFPVIGKVPINKLTHQDVFEVIRPIWQSQINAAPETLNWIRRTFAWAKAKGWCSGDNPADRDGSLGVLLEPLNKNKRKVENLPALAPGDIPKFMAVCLQRKDNSYRLLAFSIVTVLRGKMARCLKWEHYDPEAKTLSIPEELLKTKGRGSHIVYLSKAAIELLEAQPRVSKYVFPSPRNKNMPMSDNALSICMHRLHDERFAIDGVGWVDPVMTEKKGRPVIATQHGTARAGFKTWCRTGENRVRFDDEAVELCMAHRLRDDYNGAYNRATLANERRAVMEAWGDYCLSVYHSVRNQLL